MAHPDFEELLAEFNVGHVRYLIAGAHAVALHARPRASKDLDLYIDPSVSNATRAVKALAHFFGGLAPQDITIEALLDPHSILQLGVAPVRVDLLSHLATVTFRMAWSRRETARFGSVQANFLGLEDLIAEKQHWSRPQDLADLVSLRRALGAARGSARSSKRASRQVNAPLRKRSNRQS